jgi:hypothetical protein
MLIKQCDFNTQRFSDSLHFNHHHHCNEAENVLTNSCIHLNEKNTIIYLSDDEVEKLETIKPLLFNLSKQEIINIVNLVNNRPKELSIKAIAKLFNTKFGWFFKNGNKV